MTHPLGLPRGSVRALLALSIVGTVVYLLQQRTDVPLPLLNLLFIVLAYYFGNRGGAETTEPKVEPQDLPTVPDEDGVHAPEPARGAAPACARATPRREWSPLFLPRGTVRFLLLCGLGFGVFTLWGEQRLDPSAQSYAETFTVLLLIGAFVGGAIVRGIFGVFERGGQSGRLVVLRHIKAIAALGATTAYVVLCVLDAEHHVDSSLQYGVVGVVAFYFGSR